MSDDELKIITHSITRLLAMREHSRREIRRKLAQKGFDPVLVNQQLDKFVEQNIQSESRFSEMLVRSRSTKGQGENRIRAELREHQIDDQTIAWALRECDVDFFALAAEVLHKKYGTSPAKSWPEKQKRMRFLQYRGFSHEQIKEAVG